MIFYPCSSRNPWAVSILAVFIVVGSAVAQDYSSMGISSLFANANASLERGDFSSAIPALEEVIRRTADLTDTQGRETLQQCRFQLARAHFQEGNSAAGMAVLKEYLGQEPRKQERMALRLMAQGYFDTQEWGEIEQVASRLLAMPDLDADDAYTANLLLGQAKFRQEKWVECVAPLSYAAKHSKDERTKLLTQIMVVRALVESENWRELYAWIPRIYSTDAKYDISLNLTLMKAGKARFEGNDYLNALLLYRMVLPREKLIGFSNNKVDTLTKALAKDARAGIKDVDREDRQKQIDDLKESIKVLSDLPAYEDEVTFRIGQIYAEVKRYWEGYVLFDKLYAQDRNSDIGEASMLQSVLILYDVKEVDRAEKRILQYLDEKPRGQYARTLLSIMIRENLVKQNLDKVIMLRKSLDSLPPAQNASDEALGADLHYMVAFAYFQNKDFALAAEQFGMILEQYPDSSNAADSLYYRGMAYLLQGDYKNALTDFKDYQVKNIGSELYPASMFREGVCLFGLDEIPESEKAFTRFIGTYPDDVLVSEAYSMRGDIEGAKESSREDPNTLDRALADYRKAIDKASAPLQASYAAFQAAKVYKLEFRWKEIIDLMNYYMNLFGNKADVAQAVFWIGQSQIELGQVQEALTAYLDAIERFGNDVEQEGVDKIVRELVSIANGRLEDEDRAGLTTKLKLRLAALGEGQDALRLRMRVALAMLESTEATNALGVELLAEHQDLAQTSPISLALMCDAATSSGDAGQMMRLYNYFAANFADSDLLWHANRAKTYALLAAEDYPGVLAAVDDAQSLFGADDFMGWAQLVKANTLYKMGQYDEAQEAFNMIMGVGAWRGPIFAEAMYGMGRCRLAMQDFATAHSFFQRTYLLFKMYDNGNWAADGYLAAADCLIKLGREADAVNTWNAMLQDSYVNSLPQADTARELIKKHGGAL